jgi:hypothetical protein
MPGLNSTRTCAAEFTEVRVGFIAEILRYNHWQVVDGSTHSWYSQGLIQCDNGLKVFLSPNPRYYITTVNPAKFLPDRCAQTICLVPQATVNPFYRRTGNKSSIARLTNVDLILYICCLVNEE